MAIRTYTDELNNEIYYIELKPHRWTDRKNVTHNADFFPFIDGIPKYNVDCESACAFYVDGANCKKCNNDNEDELIYPFCGPVCGYFQIREGFVP